MAADKVLLSTSSEFSSETDFLFFRTLWCVVLRSGQTSNGGGSFLTS